MNVTTQAPGAVDGRSARWAQHREQRRAALLDVARKVIHADGADVTMEDIAAASGTSKSIVYRYFTDKGQLQQALGLHILDGMHRRLVSELAELEESGRAVTAEDRIRAMVSTYVHTAEQSPGLYRFVTRPSEGLNHFLADSARLVVEAVPTEDPDRVLWSTGAIGFVQNAVDHWMTLDAENPDRPTADHLADALVRWLMKGLDS